MTEYTVNSNDIYLEDVAELMEALKANDYRRINNVLIRCVTDIDGNPLERIKAAHAAKLAKRIIEAMGEDDAGN